MLEEAVKLLKDETNTQLPEGQLRVQVEGTLQEQKDFMKTVGCETEDN